ncbi:UDP-N-acetylglucosamine 2-epimerase [Microbulbifer sp. OS29]|uniref:UDP-N-acetylglucosamine 2-epimerase n=1 Tax=Microbulbifer okhotskensis TaxID=2926617 RepID=A0A9X2EU91_9GAMM|nr:UDP-N-acetylglucosamine 2-epimerase [Microbulbifer okhotskensis]MCO1335931.1 UDP-N-acetylglucosamine 2-epimerase [Microbulbifer okhotskensis]
MGSSLAGRILYKIMKKILFLTGTRADFGKLKPLMRAVEDAQELECHIFITGMHTLNKYGKTELEVKKEFTENTFVFYNQHLGEPMEVVLANTIKGLSRYIHENKPDLLVVHGDRVEALAGAIAGSVNNVLVCHVEGGERSGTIDELIRHSVSKLSHLHMVANEEAKTRLLQMGEDESSVFVIGSPDIDIMKSKSLPSLGEVKSRYEIPFEQYGILLYHPVTTALDTIYQDTQILCEALKKSNKKFVVIFPNNDEGSQVILDCYEQFKGDDNFKVFPSIKFERFLTLLKNAQVIIGNSSAGIREAPAYAVPTINMGSRQNSRYLHNTIINCDFDLDKITNELSSLFDMPATNVVEASDYFGSGNSAQQFIEVLLSKNLWELSPQKLFIDRVEA